MLSDYGMSLEVLTMYCDNLSVMCLSKNLVQHSSTKHINIHHHFIKELIENNKLVISHIYTEKQLADILTKALDISRFEQMRTSLGIRTI